MIHDSDDRQLHALFHEELGNDGTNAPEFAAVWTKAACRHNSRVRTLRALAVAALLAIAMSTAFFSRPAVKPSTRLAVHFPSLESRDLPWRSAILVTEWRAPSDALLPAKLQP